MKWVSMDFILSLFLMVCFFFFNDEEPQIHPTVAGFASFVFIDVRSVDLLERDHYFPSHPCVQ